MTISTLQKTLKLYLQHAWRYPRYVIGVLISVPVTVFIAQYLPPLILAKVLIRLSRGDFQPHHVWASFGGDLVLYAILQIIGGVIMWRVVDAFVWRIEAKVTRDMAQRIYSHLLSQSANFHANSFSGSLVSQTNKLVSSYVRTQDTTIFQVMPLFAGLIFTAIILAGRSPIYVAIFLAVSILFIVFSVFVTKSVRVATSRVAASESNQTGYLADSVTNVMAVKSFAGSEFEDREFNRITNKTHDLTLAVMRASRKQGIYLNTITSTIAILALVVAVVGVVSFKSDVATVYLILTYTAGIASQLSQFGLNSLRNYNRAFGDASDMVKILEIQPEIKDPLNPEEPRIKDGVIEFRDVNFAHEGAGEAIFNDLNIEIGAGQKVGLVGHSGSGKTTFMRLLLRFSDIDSGEILIDGQNIANLTQDDLRRHLSYVPQEPIMFHRSLSDNISYGQFNATHEQIVKAAKLAHADDFIKQLPDGYETLVGERGVKLSGGQRQRIAIARAILKNAPVLVLDEATSALDSESEVLIQDALWKLMEGKTAIVIAHRLSTVQKMDRIVVLDNGEIVEQGTHKELLAKGGVYAKLWAHQSGGFIDE